ncbi:ATP-binding protein [Patescibacteria group bacterium]|nr:ATP-binding protein [Patescibacteria group bacterium]
MTIKRTIQACLEKKLFQGKIVIIYGARQVGKTTLVKEIQNKYKKESVYLNCDEPDIRDAFTDRTSTELKSFLGNSRLVILDEAQRVKNIGLSLKLIADNFPKIQIIATGSSSFELSNEIAEPLTGRKYELYLYPFSLAEIRQIYSPTEITRLLEKRLILGSYPEIVKNERAAWENLQNITRSYLYKDVLRWQNIKNPEILERLLQALALQIGQEVSYNKLSGLVGVDKKTVASYIQILEKAFIIFRLNPFSRNLRNELKKLRKIYFYDNGVRNVLINNNNPLRLRSDGGALWENYLISERIKYHHNQQQNPNLYFWRTQQKREIDLIEERKGKLFAYELKWGRKRVTVPKDWRVNYPGARFIVVDQNNFLDFTT